MRVAPAAAALVALLLAPAPGLAHGDHSRIHRSSLDGPGWAAIDVEDPSQHLRVEVEAAVTELPAQLGVDVVGASGDSVFLAHWTFLKGTDGLRVEVGSGDAQLVEIHDEGSDVLVLHATFTVDLRLFTSLDPTVLSWTAGGISSTSWTVEAGSGADVASFLQGTDTFLFTDDDLHSSLAVERADHPALRGQVQGEQAIEIEDQLVGLFVNGENSTDRMRAEGPGLSRSCPCLFADTGTGQPGTYRFQATGLGYGEDRWILLGGADVRLPPTAR